MTTKRNIPKQRYWSSSICVLTVCFTVTVLLFSKGFYGDCRPHSFSRKMFQRVAATKIKTRLLLFLRIEDQGWRRSWMYNPRFLWLVCFCLVGLDFGCVAQESNTIFWATLGAILSGTMIRTSVICFKLEEFEEICDFISLA